MSTKRIPLLSVALCTVLSGGTANGQEKDSRLMEASGDVERGPADGTGGAEDDEVLHETGGPPAVSRNETKGAEGF